MNGSRTIQVVKRDGTCESFNQAKLASVIRRAMSGGGGCFSDADRLAEAIQIYLRRSGRKRISSAAIFEMVIRILRRAGLDDGAHRLESHRLGRNIRRRLLRIRHDGELVTMWDKSWLSEFAARSWQLMPSTGRIIAGQVEQRLLESNCECLTRQKVLDLLNDEVAAAGLCEAVLVALGAGEGS